MTVRGRSHCEFVRVFSRLPLNPDAKIVDSQPAIIIRGDAMNLNDAIKAHSDWKVKLRGAIASQTQLDSALIAKDDQCALGKWLHGDSKAQFGMLASHRECMRLHAAFHKCAGKVAAVINAGEFSKAEGMLNSGTEYALASNAVVIAIGALKREAKL